jgi:hypothetical protein
MPSRQRKPILTADLPLGETGGATRQIDGPNKLARYSLAWPKLPLIQFRGWIFPAVR